MPADAQPIIEVRKRRWYNRQDARFLIVVAIFFAVFFGQGFVNGPGRISDELHAALKQNPKSVNLSVTAKFPAEAYHMGVYQDLGAMRGNEGRVTTLFRVKPADVRTLSRYYWIEKLDLAPPGK